MNDANTRFILKRMDDGFLSLREHMDKKYDSLSHKMDELQAFKNRVVGMAIVAGAISSFAINLIMKLL